MIALLAGERQRGESSKAAQACNDYLRLGPGRSLHDLWRVYAKVDQSQPPTRSLGTIKSWSARYGWQSRAADYDAKLEEEKNARAEKIMQSGLALEHERVDNLKDLAIFLWGEITTKGEDDSYPNVWLPDVKQIGSGVHAERVDIERFNSPLISEFRATLDDLAKETGGRKQRHEHTGEGGGAIPVKHYITFSPDEWNEKDNTDSDV
jgi:hypothetical protein